jgi:hypothetical protein
MVISGKLLSGHMWGEGQFCVDQINRILSEDRWG